jgi:Uma2 family endonuclease
MTQAKPRFPTFEAYLEHDSDAEGRYELINADLVELPPESEPNISIANYLFLVLVNSGVPFRLIHTGRCEIQVPVLQSGDAQNRYPDLVVLEDIHLELMQKRLTIKLDMPPPKMIAEVVSPGQSNRERDYSRKQAQYCKRQVPEYWIIDRENQIVTVLKLETNEYIELGLFQGSDRILSPSFSNLCLTAAEIFQVVQ